jgi:hypothetical protein
MLLNCESEKRMITIIENHDLVINILCVYVISMWETRQSTDYIRCKPLGF